MLIIIHILLFPFLPYFPIVETLRLLLIDFVCTQIFKEKCLHFERENVSVSPII